MSYPRVLPRDLFNEGNLLTCYGRLFLNLHEMGALEDRPPCDEPFEIRQDPGDGSLYIANVELTCVTGRVQLRRPLNSRDKWPLYATFNDSEEVEVFRENGEFSTDFLTNILRFKIS